MLFRPRRDRRGPDPFLNVKAILLALGGCLAVAGFMLRIDWLVTVAILPLIIGLAVNFRRTSGDDATPDIDPDPADHDSSSNDDALRRD
jgi:hypothetical protein